MSIFSFANNDLSPDTLILHAPKQCPFNQVFFTNKINLLLRASFVFTMTNKSWHSSIYFVLLASVVFRRGVLYGSSSSCSHLRYTNTHQWIGSTACTRILTYTRPHVMFIVLGPFAQWRITLIMKSGIIAAYIVMFHLWPSVTVLFRRLVNHSCNGYKPNEAKCWRSCRRYTPQLCDTTNTIYICVSVIVYLYSPNNSIHYMHSNRWHTQARRNSRCYAYNFSPSAQ